MKIESSMIQYTTTSCKLKVKAYKIKNIYCIRCHMRAQYNIVCIFKQMKFENILVLW